MTTNDPHTPGPWKTREGFHADTIEIFHPDESVKPPFYPCEIATTPNDRATAKANARLIAAAPDLLEALRGMLEVFGDEFGIGSSETCDAARAAVAKSTGGAA